MDNYFLFFIIIILIILYYYFLNTNINIKEYFSNKITPKKTLYDKFKLLDSQKNKKVINNPNFIFTTIDGMYHIFTNNKYTKLDSENKILIDNEPINNYWNVPYLNIRCGYYDYINNNIIFIIEDNVYIFD